jgi:hypothetical protein
MIEANIAGVAMRAVAGFDRAGARTASAANWRLYNLAYSPPGKELRIGALFSYATVVEDHETIHLADRRQTMGNDQGGTMGE